MRIILFISLLLISFNTYAQKIEYGITLNFGYPYIADVYADPEPIPFPIASGYITSESNTTNKESYKSKPGFSFGGNLSYKISSKIAIEGGLQINLVRFQKALGSNIGGLEALVLGGQWDMDLEAQEGNPWGVIYGPTHSPEEIEIANANYDKLGNNSTLYVEIPIILAYSFNNKLKCKIGIIPSFLAYAEVYKINLIDPQSYFTTPIIKDKTADGFTNLLWNGKIGIEYLAFKNIGINIDYVRSLNSIYDKGISWGKPKYNIFSLGITYHFLNNLDQLSK